MTIPLPTAAIVGIQHYREKDHQTTGYYRRKDAASEDKQPADLEAESDPG